MNLFTNEGVVVVVVLGTDNVYRNLVIEPVNVILFGSSRAKTSAMLSPTQQCLFA